MNLAALSIKRPTFITCVVILMLALGYMALKKMAVDLFPNVTFPIVTVTTPYPGAGPKEVEISVSQPLEDEMSTLPGIKTLRSINREGVSTVVAEFVLETDIKYAEQQVRDRLSSARRKFPDDVEESIIRRIDPADQPILAVTLTADLPEAALFDLADEVIRPKIEQVNQVGLVDIYGGRKREIRVELDRAKLKSHEISASMVANRIKVAGQDVPGGKVDEGKMETVIRTVGEFKTLKDIEGTIVNFFANDVPVSVGEVGVVKDTLEDEKTRTFVNGKKGLIFNIYRQSGANTIAVVKSVRARVAKINEELKATHPGAEMAVVRDGSKNIKANVDDVNESIIIGIILTILVVYFFLGNGRSTFITSLALPNSLLGAFILMGAAGFSVNVMTLLALSLAVGLLVDDAIVVRENIYRHIEMGKTPIKAALEGTNEVSLAVVATTLTVIAVFGPIAFLQGVVGQFFKEFGLTICFAMAISLFDALTIAPMMSAYFAGDVHGKKDTTSLWARTMGRALTAFDRFQTQLENGYEKILIKTLAHPIKTLLLGLGVFVLSLVAAKFVPKTFLPAQDTGEFSVGLDMPPGTSLDSMSQTAQKIDEIVRSHKEVRTAVLTTGSRDGEANIAEMFVELVPARERNKNTSEVKDAIREGLKDFAYANPKVKDFDAVGAGQRPFNVNIIGDDLGALEKYTAQVFEKIRHNPALKDPDISYRPGKPEFQIVLDNKKSERMGVSGNLLGLELRTQIEGAKPAVFRENSREYDIRVRLKDDQRNLKNDFAQVYVPNINNTLVKLSNVAQPVETTGPANINRQDRGRYVQISADIAPDGPGMAGATQLVRDIISKELPLPPGMRYAFVGQAENFAELMQNMLVAAGLGVLFIYLVLASLYESFVTPFTIMLVLPLAACGAFYALLISGKSLDLFSMIGCIMLLGVATKNSILLVDYTNQMLAEGMNRRDAIIRAGKVRLRPILMTTFALIAGMIPIAVGLNEASKQRTSMGIAIIGGLISSTLLTLVVVPAAFSYVDRFRVWIGKFSAKIAGTASATPGSHS